MREGTQATTPQAPHSLEAEREVLATVMLDETSLDRLAAMLEPADFYVERHQHIWRAMLHLRKAETPIDIVTMAETLRSMGSYDRVGGMRSIGELTDRAGMSANALHYANIVRGRSVARKLLDVARQIEVKCCSDMHVSEIPDFFAESEKAIGAVFKESRRLVDREDWIRVTELNVERAFTPPETIPVVPTGLAPLDLHMPSGGLEPGWLVVAMCGPGVGKTTFALGNVTRTACMAQMGTVYFSAEMGAERLNVRMLAGESGVSSRALKRGDMTDAQKAAWGEASLRVAEWPLEIERVKGVDHIVTTLRAAKERGVGIAKRPLRFAVVDYLQRVKNGMRLGFEDIEHTAHTLQDLASELQIPILALSQPSTSARREKKALTAADAKGSGAIEEDCDMFLVLERGVTDRDAAGLEISKFRDGDPFYWPAEDIKVGKRDVSACGWRWDRRAMRMVVPG